MKTLLLNLFHVCIHFVLLIKTHDSVSCGSGVQEIAVVFMHPQPCAMMSNPNGQWSQPPRTESHIHSSLRSLKPFPSYESAKFHKNFFVFLLRHFVHFAKNCYNSQTRTLIQQKFGESLSGPIRPISASIFGQIRSTFTEL